VQNPEPRFHFAICNEIFQDAPLETACRVAAEIGFHGIELAPHTLAEDAALLSSAERRHVRETIRATGLEFVGLHWLLVSPPGLHVTSMNAETRRRSWSYVKRSVELCGELAESNRESGPVIVLGSPKQRSTRDGVSAAEGVSMLVDELAALASDAERAGVTVLVEAIPAAETNVVNTLAEAAAVVARVQSPAVQTMFDVHNAADETDAHEVLIARYLSLIRHVHVNEPDGQEPGMGTYDFAAVLRALASGGYTGWVSVESFDFSRTGADIAQRSMNSLRESAARI
jgi:sugar phosphate isomerase/epimerase